MRFLILLLCLTLATPASSQPRLDEAKLLKSLRKTVQGKGGCTAIKKQFRLLRPRYPDYTFAFAGRKDNTITGIRGCGFAFYKDQATAEARAMENCRPAEEKYGTDGGKKTCRLID